jgi:hypothetical protein
MLQADHQGLIVEELNKFTMSDLEKYVEFAKSLRDASIHTASAYRELTPEILESLIKYARRAEKWPSFSLLGYKHSSYACGCMGITNPDDFVCGCAMGSYLEHYKYEVALEIKRRM